MPTTNIVSFRDLRKNLFAFRRQARQGEEITVTSRGKVGARIMPPTEPQRRPINLTIASDDGNFRRYPITVIPCRNSPSGLVGPRA